jgi:hypothetical protein
MGEIKEEPLSDNETEPMLSLVEVQLSDKQEQISEPLNFIAVKSEFQVNISVRVLIFLSLSDCFTAHSTIWSTVEIKKLITMCIKWR